VFHEGGAWVCRGREVGGTQSTFFLMVLPTLARSVILDGSRHSNPVETGCSMPLKPSVDLCAIKDWCCVELDLGPPGTTAFHPAPYSPFPESSLGGTARAGIETI